MSKEIVVTASSTSSAPSPGSRAMEARKFSSAPWEIATPFGFPVLPLV